MWIITQHGFFSVVRDRENATRFLIRARVRRDLLNLKSLAGLEAEVQTSPEREYPFRLRVEEREFPRVMNALGNTVDYPSFSARIAQRIDQACRTLLYGELFATLRELYDPEQRSLARRPAPPEEPPQGPHYAAVRGGGSTHQSMKTTAQQSKSMAASELPLELPLNTEAPLQTPPRKRLQNARPRLARA